MQHNQLDLFGNTEQAGYRLDYLEVYNWGTFHNKIWKVNIEGSQSLLTGDVGSGKSSLVDAITTLLVPHHKITYNKAAGAEKQERSLNTYIRGAYGNEQDSETQGSKLLTLRDESNYSVILGVFRNRSMQRSLTLAQVFRIKKGEKQPERFYVLSENSLSIKEHFSKIKKDISDIKSLLKANPGTDVFDTFKEYNTRFRQEFGLKSDQALDLFYQAVSMKSVGNLTDFVRTHMLERTDVDDRIQELCTSFEDLNKAHESILDARKQISLLGPICEVGTKYEENLAKKEDLTQKRDYIEIFFADLKKDIFKDHLKQRQDKLEKNELRKNKLQISVDEERTTKSSLEWALRENGGDRLEVLKNEIDQKTKEKNKRLKLLERYSVPCKALELTVPKDSDHFLINRHKTSERLTHLKKEKEVQDLENVELQIHLKEFQKKEQGLIEEIKSLKTRKNNIPSFILDIRTEMLKVIDLTETDIPFAGEILQIKNSEKIWQGAIERLLHNFGMSLLVSESHYPLVSAYVNKTNLKGKLVYFRVQTEKKGATRFSPTSLPAKLDVKRDSIYFEWLRNEIENHFNFECCESIEDFQRYPKALSLTGQMKTGGKKHEKDDRFSLNDRSRYILGWSSVDKVLALQQELSQIQTEGQSYFSKLQTLADKRRQLDGLYSECKDLLYFDNYEDLSWQTIAENIISLSQELEKITTSSNLLATLGQQLKECEQKIVENQSKLDELIKENGGLEKDISNLTENIVQTSNLIQAKSESERKCHFPFLRELCEGQNLLAGLHLQNVNSRERDLRTEIHRLIDNLTQTMGRQNDKLISQVRDFSHLFREKAAHIDASLASLPEIRLMLAKLQDEDLPRHEARFHMKLKEDTINGMAMFQELLEKERRSIENKIKVINTCLQQIDYNPGTYISLQLNKNNDQEIGHFRNDIRMILSNTTGPENLYTEQKFKQVKDIIDRLKGRSQSLDIDKKWVQKVTDVRNWFNFAASERWKEDHQEKEFYPDSGGKSGGQKEKLAYTVLASALAYQYGLDGVNNTPKSFRFVMIDEAFGRGSDDSARYGLTLFEKLNLQLLVVTPLQKIHVIEDHVDYVHYVHNEGSKNSVLRTLTVEQFKAEKIKHLGKTISEVNS
jgi:uncharacterized protein YPO0396